MLEILPWVIGRSPRTRRKHGTQRKLLGRFSERSVWAGVFRVGVLKAKQGLTIKWFQDELLAEIFGSMSMMCLTSVFYTTDWPILAHERGIWKTRKLRALVVLRRRCFLALESQTGVDSGYGLCSPPLIAFSWFVVTTPWVHSSIVSSIFIIVKSYEPHPLTYWHQNHCRPAEFVTRFREVRVRISTSSSAKEFWKFFEKQDQPRHRGITSASTPREYAREETAFSLYARSREGGC